MNVTAAELDVIGSDLPEDDVILDSVMKLVLTLVSTKVACTEVGSVVKLCALLEVTCSELLKDGTVVGSVNELCLATKLDSVEVNCSELFKDGTDLGSVIELCLVTNLDSMEVTCSELLKDGVNLGSVIKLCVVMSSSEVLFVNSSDMKCLEMQRL